MINSDASICLKYERDNAEILYDIYLINCNGVDDDTVAAMIDADSI